MVGQLSFKTNTRGNSLVVQWLGLCASTAGGTGLIPSPSSKKKKLTSVEPPLFCRRYKIISFPCLSNTGSFCNIWREFTNIILKRWMTKRILIKYLDNPQKRSTLGFHSGSGVKNSPANAGDTGSIPGAGRSQMPWGNWAGAPQLVSLHTLEPMLCNERSHHNKKPSHNN